MPSQSTESTKPVSIAWPDGALSTAIVGGCGNLVTIELETTS